MSRPLAPLTPRQQKILDFMLAYQRRDKYPPTIRDIGTHFGIKNPNGVAHHLKSLLRKGKIRQARGRKNNSWIAIDNIESRAIALLEGVVLLVRSGLPLIDVSQIESFLASLEPKETTNGQTSP